MSQSSDTNPEYWDTYTNLQHVKHQIIRHYLNGWFPKLSSWAKRILYVDTHAGKGKYKSGRFGSPLVALHAFLDHGHRDKILERCEVSFVFIEKDDDNYLSLREEVNAISNLPDKVLVAIEQTDSFEHLSTICDRLKREDKKLAPSFFFIDPYGFKVPCQLLREIKSFPSSELFETFMWRELDMAICNKERPQIETLNSVFGCTDWQKLSSLADSEERAVEAIGILRGQIGAKWVTPIRMCSANRVTRYFLLHYSDHPEGRKLMKEAMWKYCPDGYAIKSDDPSQQFLIELEPNLKPLEKWIECQLNGGPKRWSELDELLLDEEWLSKHLNKSVQTMYKSDILAASNFQGRFSRKANPLLSLTKE